jgi:hypothetical protein
MTDYFVFFFSIGLITTGLHRLLLQGANFVPFLEILAGILVWTPYRDIVLYAWLLGAVLFSLSILSSQNMYGTYPDIFTAQKDPMAVYFHLTWALVLLYVLWYKKKNG